MENSTLRSELFFYLKNFRRSKRNIMIRKCLVPFFDDRDTFVADSMVVLSLDLWSFGVCYDPIAATAYNYFGIV